MTRTRTQTDRFLAAIFEPTDIIEIRLLPSARSEWYAASDELPLASWAGQNIYVGGNPRKAKGCRDAAGVALARCLFADLDNVGLEEAATRLKASGLPAPSVVVASGGGVHFWWRLVEPMTDLAAWTKVQEGIIAALGSDRVVKDPPRIMRLPGTQNVKRGKPCELVEASGHTYDLGLFQVTSSPAALTSGGMDWVGDKPDLNAGGGSVKPNPGGMEGLSRATLLFLAQGAHEGERNVKLFAAACDFAGCRIPQTQAEHELGRAAAMSGLPASEVAAAIKSAYAKGRAPAKTTVYQRREDATRDAAQGHAPTIEREEEQQTPDIEPARHVMSNVIDAWRETVKRGKEGKAEAKQEHYLVHKPMHRISGEMLHASGGWPKILGQTPFFIRGSGLWASTMMLATPDDLFGWLHGIMDVRWSVSQVEDANSGAALSAPTKAEFYRHLRLGCDGVERFDSVTAYPHEPPLPRVYYMPVDLPPATGAALTEYLDAFNPETEDDRKLMLACLLTMGWGGQPGTRPMFVFTSAAGVGAGKTATAEALADVWGGRALMDYTQDWATLSKGLMSSDDWNARCILFDNVKGKYGGSALEAMVTAKTLNGWRAYVGNIARPNDAVIMVTYNLPELTRDMAERAVVIKIGRPQHDKAFVTWAAEFVKENREPLLADLLAILKRKPHVEIPPGRRDRWQTWQQSILGRIDGGDRLADIISARRPAVDSDRDDAAVLCEMLLTCASKGELTSHELRDAAIKAQIWKDDQNKSIGTNVQTCVAWARRILSGRNVIEPAMSDAGSQRRIKRYDAGECVGRSPVWSINVAAARETAIMDGDEIDLPV